MGIKFDMLGLFVSDIAQMVDFYRDIIGIDIDWNGEGPYAEFHHEGIRFAMYERNMLPQLLGQNPSYPDRLNGTFELAVNVGKPEPWKMRSAMITDPEGNLIEIASDFWD